MRRCIDDFHKYPDKNRALLAKLSSTFRNRNQVTFCLLLNPVFNQAGCRVATSVEWLDISVEMAAEQAQKEFNRKIGNM